MSAESLPLKWIDIDLAALEANAAWVASRLQPGVAFTAVVKADGYGHGAVETARAALKAGATHLGVRDLSEAAVLRKAGLKAPILLLAPILLEQARAAIRLDVTPTVDALEQARALAAAAGRTVSIHLDLDSGLGRWGASPRELPSLMKAIARLKRVRVSGLSTHIDYVPGKNAVEAEEKLGAFQRLAAPYKRENASLLVHAANSSVFMDFPHRQFDMVCVGNLLYGINPSKSRPAPLKSPWRFSARVLKIRDVRKGASIGYASEYVAPRRMKIATLAAGYADGLTMEPAERLIGYASGRQYWGMRGGVKLPFVGRCGIMHVLVDASGSPGLKVGDAVVLPVRRTSAARVPRVYL